MKSEPCSNYFHYKAFGVPRCNCFPCWKKYFEMNPEKFYTAVRAIKELGVETVRKVQGDKYIRALNKFLKEQNANEISS